MFRFLKRFAIETRFITCVLPWPSRGGGWRGAIFTSFSIRQDDITSSFSYKAALLSCGGIQEKRKKRNKTKHHNYAIKEHNISYLDNKNEVTLTMQCSLIFFLFSPPIWRPWRFLPWSRSLRLKLHDIPLVSLSFLFSFFWALLWWPRKAWAPKAPPIRQWSWKILFINLSSIFLWFSPD